MAALQHYVDACRQYGVPWVAEFVEALSSGHRECILANREQDPITDIGLACMAQGLRHEHSIKTLDLDGNSFGEAGLFALLEALIANPRIVRELRLSRNSLGDAAVGRIGDALASGLGLRILDLSHDDITAEGLAALFPPPSIAGVGGAPAHRSTAASELCELSLHGNMLEPGDAATIAVAIRQSGHLRHLHLGMNALGSPGATVIARALQTSRSLMTIDLSANHIGSEGGAELAAALRKPSCPLQRVNIRENEFNEATLGMFLDVLGASHPTALTQLHLGFCAPMRSARFTERALRVLKGNTSLLLLDILGWECPPDTELVRLLADLMAANTTLRALLMSNVCEDAKAVVDGANHNRARSQAMQDNVLYLGDDELVGAAAASTASRRRRRGSLSMAPTTTEPSPHRAPSVAEVLSAIATPSHATQGTRALHHDGATGHVEHEQPHQRSPQRVREAEAAGNHGSFQTDQPRIQSPVSRPRSRSGSVQRFPPQVSGGDVEALIERVARVPTNEPELRDTVYSALWALYRAIPASAKNADPLAPPPAAPAVVGAPLPTATAGATYNSRRGSTTESPRRSSRQVVVSNEEETESTAVGTAVPPPRHQEYVRDSGVRSVGRATSVTDRKSSTSGSFITDAAAEWQRSRRQSNNHMDTGRGSIAEGNTSQRSANESEMHTPIHQTRKLASRRSSSASAAEGPFVPQQQQQQHAAPHTTVSPPSRSPQEKRRPSSSEPNSFTPLAGGIDPTRSVQPPSRTTVLPTPHERPPPPEAHQRRSSSIAAFERPTLTPRQFTPRSTSIADPLPSPGAFAQNGTRSLSAAQPTPQRPEGATDAGADNLEVPQIQQRHDGKPRDLGPGVPEKPAALPSRPRGPRMADPGVSASRGRSVSAVVAPIAATPPEDSEASEAF